MKAKGEIWYAVKLPRHRCMWLWRKKKDAEADARDCSERAKVVKVELREMKR